MPPLREWYFVRFDDCAIALQVNPPDGTLWEATIPWERIIRICFKTGDWFESDEIYIFTDERSESYLIPTEAEDGKALWDEILERKLYHGEVAIDLPATMVEADALPLDSPEQLPELEGETLILTWDQIQSDSIILHGDVMIWRERTGWEVYDRFEEIAIILKRKYGKHLVDILPTARSLFALYGDSTAASFHVTSVRESLGRESKQNTTTNSDRRLSEIRSLLKTALDCEEEYLYEGAMGNYYMNSYATDAASELDDLFRASKPTAIEINCCVAALSDPKRIKQGRSKQLLLKLRERSRPILNALANSPDPQLRIFALETAKTSVNPLCFMPLYGSIDLEQRLLNDPDENVRIVAILASKQTIDHNAEYLQRSLQTDPNNPMSGLFYQLLTLLNDSSAKVRAVAAKALGGWASYVGHEALDIFLERENDLEAREALAMAKALCPQP
jgi:HEAT repeat protein